MSKSTVKEIPLGGFQCPTLPFFHGFVFAASLGTFISILDFVLFEIHRNRPVVYELIFAKPKFIGVSYLACHILSFVLVAVLIYCFAFLIRAILRSHLKITHSFLARFVTVVMFPLLIVGLRLKRFSEQPYCTISFILIILVIIVFEFRYLRRTYFDQDFDLIVFFQLSRWMLLATSVALFTAFLAPDALGFYERFFRQERGHDGGYPNVILVVLDTVRADHLSCYGYTENQTPNIDHISRDGLLFMNAYSAAPWTLPSHASMFTGLLTSQHRADWGHRFLTEDHFTLAEYLREVGYRTAGFSENPNVTSSNGLAQGFTEFHDIWRAPLFVRVMRRINDRFHFRNDRHEYARRTSGLFRRWAMNGHSSGRPIFAFINLMAAHLPRYPRTSPGGKSWSSEEVEKIEPVNLVPERYYLDQYKLGPDELDMMRDIYDQEISYVDRCIGDLVDVLRDQQLLDNTILIITSDHGELFGEHDFIEHQLCLYEPVLRVPLIIRYPRKILPRIIDENVSTAALFSTIVEILGIPERNSVQTPNEITKSALSRTAEDMSIVAEFTNGVKMMKRAIQHEARDFDFSPFDQDLKSIIMGNYKYIWYSTGREELFDLGADPDELFDLSSVEKNLARHHRQVLAELTVFGEDALDSDPASPIDPATRDALRALGYEP